MTETTDLIITLSGVILTSLGLLKGITLRLDKGDLAFKKLRASIYNMRNELTEHRLTLTKRMESIENSLDNCRKEHKL